MHDLFIKHTGDDVLLAQFVIPNALRARFQRGRMGNDLRDPHHQVVAEVIIF